VIGNLEARKGDLSLLARADDRARHPPATAGDRIARHLDVDPPDAVTQREESTAPPSTRVATSYRPVGRHPQRG
jgi:hypothetical protein